ncbi:hypothetical protein Glove_156g82 [Diversispora epigaea]|uniref:Uncharacterized protein n=1 Tax=Diversispora epigaea TaxID=1348612 RepID=A0A397IVP9_9GLOM|nr:hypothetical protein Glove_156g82 [Diversispora epigaea]
MTKYLTPHILSVEQSKMAQYLYFVVNQINLTNDNEDFSSLEVGDEFVENLYDAKQILLKSMITEVDEENIQKYTDAQKDNNIVTEACCFINKESAKNYSNELLTLNSSTIPKSVTHVLCRAAQRKLKYGEVWRLARHAAQLTVEYNNYSEMVTEIAAGSVQNQDFQEFTEIQDDANKENELGLIKNLLVSRRKGRCHGSTFLHPTYSSFKEFIVLPVRYKTFSLVISLFLEGTS